MDVTEDYFHHSKNIGDLFYKISLNSLNPESKRISQIACVVSPSILNFKIFNLTVTPEKPDLFSSQLDSD